MQTSHVGLSASVPPILPEEIQDRFPRFPTDPDRRIEEELVPQSSDAVVELEVLVRIERSVPPADLPKQRGRIRAERDVVDGSGSRSEVVRGTADPEPGRHRLSDRLACSCRGDAVLPASHASPTSFTQVIDRSTDVSLSDLRVRVHSHDPPAASTFEAEVE